MWRLNVGILTNVKVVEELKTEIKKYMEENNNGAVEPHFVWDALKVAVQES